MGLIIILLIIAIYIFIHKRYKKQKLNKKAVTSNQVEYSTIPERQPHNIQLNNLKINVTTKKWRNTCNEFVAIDVETTGLNYMDDEIIEVAAIKFKNGQAMDSFSTLIKPPTPIPEHITNINGITNEMVKDAPTLYQAMPYLIDFIGRSILVMHNASFDLKFLKYHAMKLGYDINNPYIDTLPVCKKLFTGLKNHKLPTIADHIGLRTDSFHRAYNDAMICGQVLLKCIEILNKNEYNLAEKLLKEAEKRTTFEDENVGGSNDNTEYRKIIDRHFTYNHYIEFYYKQRDKGPEYIEKCIEYCKKDIELFPKFKEAWINGEISEEERAAGYNFNLRIPAFERLSIIYEKQGKIDEAIMVCKKAIKYSLHDGTKGDFQGRLNRLLSKTSTKYYKEV